MKKSEGFLLILLTLFCAILPARADAVGDGTVLFVLAVPVLIIAVVIILIVLFFKNRKNK
ncbi:MAG: hypothetical protein J6H18_04105 [Lachnospiraceae bacterium]|nr:hypothetical protein [Lachnospiraceae bacterium]